MIHKKLDEISAEDMQILVSNAERETSTLEFKQQLPGNTNNDKKEFLADISAFANTRGGDIVFGIQEQDGVAKNAIGLEDADLDQQMQRLEQIVRDGLEPRLASIELSAVKSSGALWFLIIRIKKSWHAPHMVKFQGTSRFYKRNSGGKYQMDVNEIRSAFSQSGDFRSTLDKWQGDRIAKIQTDHPSPFQEPTVIVQIVPLDAFSDPNKLSTSQLESAKRTLKFTPFGSSGYNTSYNIDGIRNIYTDRHHDSGVRNYDSYCQLYRSGIVESLSNTIGTYIDDGPRRGKDALFHVATNWFAQHYLEQSLKYLKALGEIDVVGPKVIRTTLLNMLGASLTDARDRYSDSTVFDRETILLPDIYIDEIPTN
ncbi:MAG: ATP-binding protein [Phycisphaerales bacterium]|nr:ATP-binding protein [Phycisphaerales bacterium]